MSKWNNSFLLLNLVECTAQDTHNRDCSIFYILYSIFHSRQNSRCNGVIKYLYWWVQKCKYSFWFIPTFCWEWPPDLLTSCCGPKVTWLHMKPTYWLPQRHVSLRMTQLISNFLEFQKPDWFLSSRNLTLTLTLTCQILWNFQHFCFVFLCLASSRVWCSSFSPRALLQRVHLFLRAKPTTRWLLQPWSHTHLRVNEHS